jgi:hypothetical protein
MIVYLPLNADTAERYYLATGQTLTGRTSCCYTSIRLLIKMKCLLFSLSQITRGRVWTVTKLQEAGVGGWVGWIRCGTRHDLTLRLGTITNDFSPRVWELSKGGEKAPS